MKTKQLITLVPLFLYSCLIFSQDSLTRSMPDTLEEKPELVIDTITYSNGVMYVGEISNRRRHGYGSLITPYGDTLYVGGYHMNQRHGNGKYFFKNKNVYEGQWEYGTMQGMGKMHYASGDSYEGTWREDRKHGEGTFFFKNGDVYIGAFDNGIKHGKGKLIQKNQVYEGDWVKGTREGEGHLTIESGESQEEYKGSFRANRYHGKGSWKYVRGQVTTEYIGDWVDGARVGEGEYIINGRHLQGTWKRNEATGTGTGVSGEGVYEGEFYRGFYQGEGKFTYGNGDTYEGAWIRGKRQGYGVYTYKDGRKYEGNWYMDQENGDGVLIAIDGSKKIGKFKDGKLEE